MARRGRWRPGIVWRCRGAGGEGWRQGRDGGPGSWSGGRAACGLCLPGRSTAKSAGLVRRIGVNLSQAVANLNATGQGPGDLLPYAAESVRWADRIGSTRQRRRCTGALPRASPVLAGAAATGGLARYLSATTRTCPPARRAPAGQALALAQDLDALTSPPAARSSSMPHPTGVDPLPITKGMRPATSATGSG